MVLLTVGSFAPGRGVEDVKRLFVHERDLGDLARQRRITAVQLCMHTSIEDIFPRSIHDIFRYMEIFSQLLATGGSDHHVSTTQMWWWDRI